MNLGPISQYQGDYEVPSHLWTPFIIPYPPENLGCSERIGWRAVLEDPYCEDLGLQDGAEGIREVPGRPLPVWAQTWYLKRAQGAGVLAN